MSDSVRRGRLVFVGLGLGDETGISAHGLQEVQSCDVVFAEEYTASLSEGSIQRLEGRIGKRIERLGRATVEDGKSIIDACFGQKVALLVPGDPMTATTHVDLRLRAAKHGVETVIIHGSSVLAAVPGILGLQHYKFGRTTTIPFPAEGYSPTSPYHVISENLSRGLHTLVLLDIDAENSRYMTANEGLHVLMDMEMREAKEVITPSRLVCVVARAGSPDCAARAGLISELVSEDFGPALHTVVVPGKLHFMEEEALKVFAGLRRTP
jgi:diphthine synthase